jgi:hypothetical protein
MSIRNRRIFDIQTLVNGNIALLYSPFVFFLGAIENSSRNTNGNSEEFCISDKMDLLLSSFENDSITIATKAFR